MLSFVLQWFAASAPTVVQPPVAARGSFPLSSRSRERYVASTRWMDTSRAVGEPGVTTIFAATASSPGQRRGVALRCLARRYTRVRRARRAAVSAVASSASEAGTTGRSGSQLSPPTLGLAPGNPVVGERTPRLEPVGSGRVFMIGALAAYVLLSAQRARPWPTVQSLTPGMRSRPLLRLCAISLASSRFSFVICDLTAWL